MTHRNPCRPGGECPVCNDVEDICVICHRPLEDDETERDRHGHRICDGCAPCDCGLGEEHTGAECCREDREVGSDE